jgi:hypothetical protein
MGQGPWHLCTGDSHRTDSRQHSLSPHTHSLSLHHAHTYTHTTLTFHENLPFSFIGRTPDSGPFSLGRVRNVVNIFHRLDSRTKCSYAEFTSALDMRAIKYGKVSYSAFILYFITYKSVLRLHLSSLFLADVMCALHHLLLLFTALTARHSRSVQSMTASDSPFISIPPISSDHYCSISAIPSPYHITLFPSPSHAHPYTLSLPRSYRPPCNRTVQQTPSLRELTT